MANFVCNKCGYVGPLQKHADCDYWGLRATPAILEWKARAENAEARVLQLEGQLNEYLRAKARELEVLAAKALLEPFAMYADALSGVEDVDKVVCHRWGKALRVKDFQGVLNLYTELNK